MKIKAFLIISFFALACNGDEEKAMEAMETVPFVDIKRFMGDWFVIANIPTFIEKDATNAIESYKLNEKGEIETTFTFYQNSPNGLKKEYRPKGFIYNSKTNAEWRMQFFWPFKMPFLIIDLAEDYSHTVIGYPNRNYVWIMARKPQMTDETYARIIKKLKSVSYDVSRIEKVPQVW